MSLTCATRGRNSWMSYFVDANDCRGRLFASGEQLGYDLDGGEWVRVKGTERKRKERKRLPVVIHNSGTMAGSGLDERTTDLMWARQFAR